MNKLYINGHFLNQRVTGVQRYAIEVLNGFEQAGYPFEVIKPGSFSSANKISQLLWEQFLLPHQKKATDILWSPTNTGPAFAANHIVTLHDIGVFPHPEWFAKSYVLWKKTLIPVMAKRAVGILTVSKFSKQIICDHLDVHPDKVKVVYNGVNTERFKPASQSQIKNVIEKYDIKEPYFLTLGSLDPRKNIPALIKAWNRAVKDGCLQDSQLVIAGGSHRTLGKFTRDTTADNIRFTGYVDDDDLPPLYSGACGFLFPSLFEGFGLPVLEAMACRTPVLTSASSALDEISDNAALKVNPDDIESIKKGIIELAESSQRRNSLVQYGIERVKLFNWDRSAEAIYQYLTQ